MKKFNKLYEKIKWKIFQLYYYWIKNTRLIVVDKNAATTITLPTLAEHGRMIRIINHSNSVVTIIPPTKETVK